MRMKIALLLASALVLSACGDGAPSRQDAAGGSNSGESPVNPIAVNPDAPAGVAQEGSLTIPQQNAVKSATDYLRISGFSRDGLIAQLSSDAGDGYGKADATVAVDSLGIDWNEQAARSAREYVEMSGFSCQGLVEQLSSSAGDKYTVEQATYGAKQAGIC